MDLSIAITAEITTFLLVFARLGAALMVMPGFGEAQVNPRVRLIMAMALSLLATPLVADRLPLIPDGILPLSSLVLREIGVGILIGTILRLALLAIHFAGGAIAMQSGLAAATFFDPSEQNQSSLTSNFLTITALAVMFAANLHLLLIEGLIASYAPIAPLDGRAFNDGIEFLVRHSNDVLTWGFRFAAPLLIFSLVFQLLLGVMNRLMPAFLVFFVAIPLQLMLSMGVVMLGLGSIFYGFLVLLEETAAPLLAGG